MPLCSLYLISITPSIPLQSFVKSLRESVPSSKEPLVVGKVIRWIIPPWLDESASSESSAIEYLLSTRWHLLVIFEDVVSLPEDISKTIQHVYALQVGIPSRLTSNFLSRTNPSLLHPNTSKIPALSDSVSRPILATTTKNLELTKDILEWIGVPPSPYSPSSSASSSSVLSSSTPIKQPSPPRGAVSMLNLLSFPSPPVNPNARTSYQKYGESFSQSVGIRRGGVAKLVGTVIQQQAPPSRPTLPQPKRLSTAVNSTQSPLQNHQIWDEIALAHYPSVYHFADMVASKDYQEANRKYRVGNLRGTAILCCDELDPDVVDEARDSLDISGKHEKKAKL